MVSRTMLYGNKLYKSKKHLKKKTIVILFIIFILVATGGTYAWFISTSSQETSSLTAGRVDVAMNNTLTVSGMVLPGEPISGNVSITNTSDVNTYIRVKIEIDTLDFYQGGDTFDDIFILTLGSDWVKKGNWYYRKGIVTSGTNFTDIITDFKVKGTVGNEYQGKSFSVNATTDAIQGTVDALDGTWILSGDLQVSDKTELEY